MGSSPSKQPARSTVVSTRRASNAATSKSTSRKSVKVVTKTTTGVIKGHNKTTVQTKREIVEFSSLDDKNPVQKPVGYEESKLKKEIERKRRSYYPPINVIRKRGRARHVAAVYKMQQRQAEKATSVQSHVITTEGYNTEEGNSQRELGEAATSSELNWQSWLDRLNTLTTINEDEQTTGEYSTSSRGASELADLFSIHSFCHSLAPKGQAFWEFPNRVNRSFSLPNFQQEQTALIDRITSRSAHPNSSKLDWSLMRPLQPDHSDIDSVPRIRRPETTARFTIEGPDGNLGLDDVLPHLSGTSLALQSIPEDDGGISLSKTGTPRSDYRDDELHVPKEVKRANSDPFPWMQYPVLYQPGERRSRSMTAIEEISKLQFDFLDLSELINGEIETGGFANSTAIENPDKRRHTITNSSSLQYMTSLVDLDGRSLSQDDLYFLKDKMNALDSLMTHKPTHVTKVINLAEDVRRSIEVEENKARESNGNSLVPVSYSEVPILVDGGHLESSGHTNDLSLKTAVALGQRNSRRVSFVPELLTEDDLTKIEALRQNNKAIANVPVYEQSEKETSYLHQIGFEESKVVPILITGRSKSLVSAKNENLKTGNPRKTKSGNAKISTELEHKSMNMPLKKPSEIPQAKDQSRLKNKFGCSNSHERASSVPLDQLKLEFIPDRKVKSSHPAYYDYVYSDKIASVDPEIAENCADLNFAPVERTLNKLPESEPERSYSLPATVPQKTHSPKLNSTLSHVPIPDYHPIREEVLVTRKHTQPEDSKTNFDTALTLGIQADTTLSASIVLNPLRNQTVAYESHLLCHFNSEPQLAFLNVPENPPIPADVSNYKDTLDDSPKNTENISRELSFKLTRESTSNSLRSHAKHSPEKQRSREVSPETQKNLFPNHVSLDCASSPMLVSPLVERSKLNRSIASITEEPEKEGELECKINQPTPQSSANLGSATSESKIPRRKLSTQSVDSLDRSQKQPSERSLLRETSTPRSKPIRKDKKLSKYHDEKELDESMKPPISKTSQQNRDAPRSHETRNSPGTHDESMAEYSSDLEITQSTIHPESKPVIEADPGNLKRFFDSVDADHVQTFSPVSVKGQTQLLNSSNDAHMMDRATSVIVQAVSKDEICQTDVEDILCSLCGKHGTKNLPDVEDGSTQTLAWRGGIIRSNTIVKKESESKITQTEKSVEMLEKFTSYDQTIDSFCDKFTSKTPVQLQDASVEALTKQTTHNQLTQTDVSKRKNDSIDSLDDPEISPRQKRDLRSHPRKGTDLQRDFCHQATFESIRLMMSPVLLEEMQGLDQFQKECLLSHNMFRVKHRAPPVRWSQKLTSQAQQWANYLVSSNTLQHSHEQGYSENVMKKRLKPSEAPRGFGVVQQWYKGGRDYDYSSGSRQKLNRALHAFVKLVWLEIEDIGVGYSCDNDNNIVVVAHYKPRVYLKNIANNVFPKL